MPYLIPHWQPECHQVKNCVTVSTVKPSRPLTLTVRGNHCDIGDRTKWSYIYTLWNHKAVKSISMDTTRDSYVQPVRDIFFIDFLIIIFILTPWPLHSHVLCGSTWDKPLSCVDSFTMMTSSNGDIFRVTGLLCGEFTGPRWIPLTKASDTELWCFLWSVPEQTFK